jgi:hypothetical protein
VGGEKLQSAFSALGRKIKNNYPNSPVTPDLLGLSVGLHTSGVCWPVGNLVSALDAVEHDVILHRAWQAVLRVVGIPKYLAEKLKLKKNNNRFEKLRSST